MLEELSNKYNKEIHVLIRLTSNNQFGVNEEEFKYIIKNKNQIIIDGIEYFLWKIYDLDHEAEAYRSAFCQFSDEYYG